MRPSVILKFIFKLLLLEALIILVIDLIVLVYRGKFDQVVLLVPIGTVLSFLMTSPFAMLIYILLRNEYGYNNKILLHVAHILVFIGVLLAYGSDFESSDRLMLYVPGAAVIIAAGIVIYKKAPSDQSDLKEQVDSPKSL
jgi:hypothetical protein